ncbi:hypothetical protein LPJ53_004189 [Coemansia erecta]|uniref:WD40 repeat-like protein n=1 Tax=Coemansia erecta TaxID=147472 RepID=A0A9W8CRX9_9FUNG|nr:hypothetical protein LPJ53_004189 [Coemansia erecta]
MAADYSTETLEYLRREPLFSALTPGAVSSLRMAKQFSDNKSSVHSLDYSPDGSLCITTSTDESLRLYDCASGTRRQTLYSKKYGCHLAQFTKDSGCVAYASTKVDDTIRYLSYETNQYLRYFVGHKARVCSLQRAEAEGAAKGGVVSADKDGWVCLWDLGVPAAVARVKEGCVAAWDPSGMVVGVAGSSGVGLLDAREMSRGPFLRLAMQPGQAGPVGIRWVPPLGDHLLAMLADGSTQLWDAREGVLRTTLAGDKRKLDSGCGGGQDTTVTPDGSVVLGGRADGSVAYWDVARAMRKGGVVAADGLLNGSHSGPVSVCAFNPAFMECVTASTSLSLWTV